MVLWFEEAVVEFAMIAATLVAAAVLVRVLVGFALEYRDRRATSPAAGPADSARAEGRAHFARTVTPSH
jgi:hypothetical protein